SGQLKALAVTGKDRFPAVPDVPAAIESGVLPGYDVTTWYGVFAPRATPGAIHATPNTNNKENPKEEPRQKELATGPAGSGRAAWWGAARPPRRSASTWRASLSAGTRCARRRAFHSSRRLNSPLAARCRIRMAATADRSMHLQTASPELVRRLICET